MLNESLNNQCLQMIQEGKNMQEVIEFLYVSGTSIIQSMRMIMEIYGISLGESKERVSSHPCWRIVVEANQPLHDELEEILNKEADGNTSGQERIRNEQGDL